MNHSMPASHRAYQKIAALIAATWLAGCSVPQPAAGIAVTEQWRPPENATPWTVNRNASELEVRVFSAGALADFGHDHIIEFPVTGTVYRADTLERSGFRLRVPVTDAVVDDPGARAAAGDAFSREISTEARRGTRGNMLGDELLAADAHPEVVIESLALAGKPGELMARVRITVRGRGFERQLAARLQENNGQLEVNSEFSLSQTGLGLEQYTALGGGLRVRDKMEFRLHLVASRE